MRPHPIVLYSGGTPPRPTAQLSPAHSPAQEHAPGDPHLRTARVRPAGRGRVQAAARHAVDHSARVPRWAGLAGACPTHGMPAQLSFFRRASTPPCRARRLCAQPAPAAPAAAGRGGLADPQGGDFVPVQALARRAQPVDGSLCLLRLVRGEGAGRAGSGGPVGLALGDGSPDMLASRLKQQCMSHSSRPRVCTAAAAATAGSSWPLSTGRRCGAWRWRRGCRRWSARVRGLQAAGCRLWAVHKGALPSSAGAADLRHRLRHLWQHCSTISPSRLPRTPNPAHRVHGHRDARARALGGPG